MNSRWRASLPRVTRIASRRYCSRKFEQHAEVRVAGGFGNPAMENEVFGDAIAACLHCRVDVGQRTAQRGDMRRAWRAWLRARRSRLRSRAAPPRSAPPMRATPARLDRRRAVDAAPAARRKPPSLGATTAAREIAVGEPPRARRCATRRVIRPIGARSAGGRRCSARPARFDLRAARPTDPTACRRPRATLGHRDGGGVGVGIHNVII